MGGGILKKGGVQVQEGGGKKRRKKGINRVEGGKGGATLGSLG